MYAIRTDSAMGLSCSSALNEASAAERYGAVAGEPLRRLRWGGLKEIYQTICKGHDVLNAAPSGAYRWFRIPRSVRSDQFH